jgi:hypothetical protein
VDGQSVGQYTLPPQCTIQQIANVTCPPPIVVDEQQYRVRRATTSSALGAPTVLTNKTCEQMIAALTPSGQDAVSGQVVSLQKFYDPVAAAWKYQAVFSPPPP